MVTQLDGADLYFDRMSSSIGDKSRVIEHVKPGDILDVGCGSGDLMRAMSHLGQTYGLDASPESVLRAGPRARQGYADEPDVFGREFDTVVLCSVLHEVFSYGNRAGEIGRVSSVSDTLLALRAVMKPGSRLIIRDGVEPPSQACVMQADDSAVRRYLEASPFARPGLDRQVSLTRTARGWEGSTSSAMEFAYTHTWGAGSFAREVQEFYGLFTLDDYSDFVARYGFAPVHSESYLQPGYAEHLTDVTISTGLPDSNAIWVFDAC